MPDVYLECKVEDGFFKNEEAIITIQGVEQTYQALCDKLNIKGNNVKVYVVKKYKKGYLINLPVIDTFSSGPTIYVPKDKIKILG